MAFPFLEQFLALRPHLPAELVSEGARQRLLQQAEQLPSHWCAGSFECRLEPGLERVDVLVCATRGSGGQDALRQLLATGKCPPALRSCRRYLEEWCRPGSALERDVPLIWLEYDLHPGRPEPVPLVFVGLDPAQIERLFGDSAQGRRLSAPEVSRLAREGFCLLNGRAPEEAQLAVLERCAALLPPGGRMHHSVTMPQRGSGNVRFGALLPSEGVDAWLREVGWTGSDAQLESLWTVVGRTPGIRHVQLEVEPGGRPRPTLAFDYYFDDAAPRLTGEESRVLSELVRRGACTPERAEAALRWRGGETVSLPSSAWRVRLDRTVFFKLTAHEDGRLESKAYLCFDARRVLF
ncbi:hypothetical protein [Archangium lipolyticum]|uniref:hypothetical protein n=1 Tax=Archangium lipolyticum TaxID=2970465 RepID=UPI00214A0D65|nr:hypothetical protein [Archangium lipolyticum]